MKQDKDYGQRLEVYKWTKYSGTGKRETRTIRHMRVMGHWWKQSGIRGDVRPVTQEEGQVAWNERIVIFQNETWNSQDKKTQDTPHHSVTHWLPIKSRIEFKILFHTLKILNGQALTYVASRPNSTILPDSNTALSRCRYLWFLESPKIN